MPKLIWLGLALFATSQADFGLMIMGHENAWVSCLSDFLGMYWLASFILGSLLMGVGVVARMTLEVDGS